MNHINLFLTCHRDRLKKFKQTCCSSKCIYLLHDNKLKIMTPTWNDEFELPDGSYFVSDIQDYIGYTIKKHETLATIPPIHVYINKIDNRLVSKTKDGFKLDLQTPETMKLFGSTKLIDKTKNRLININESLKYYILLCFIKILCLFTKC